MNDWLYPGPDIEAELDDETRAALAHIREIVEAPAPEPVGHDPATCRDGDHYGQCSGATVLP